MKRQFFHAATISCVAMAVLALLTPAVSASTGKAFGPGSASSGVAVTLGTVTSASGAAMPGTTVDLYAWPSNAVQQALKPGQLVPTTLLAMATTSSAGKYMLRVPVAKLKAAAVESGYANLEISSSAGGFWFFPYQTGSLPFDPPAPVIVNLGGSEKPLCGNGPDGAPLSSTGFVKLKQLNPAWGIVGQGYIAPLGAKTAGDKVNFEYDQTMSHTQSSTLGIGLSGYGVDAGYTGSGSNVSTANPGQGYPAEHKSSLFRTEFNVEQDRTLCVSTPNHPEGHKKQHGKCPLTYKANANTEEVYKCIWMVKSTGWFGPSGSVVQRIRNHPIPVPRTPAKFCGFELAGGEAKTNKQKAIMWSNGFEIGVTDNIKDVTLKASYSSTAQTGYDANAQMLLTFGHSGWICGTNHDTKTAAILVMRGNKT